LGARYYDSDLSIWLSVDAMSDKYPSLSPYAYCAGNPIRLIDPDGNDWYEDEEGKIKWTDYTSQAQMRKNKLKGTYLGEAVVVFNGSRYEQAGTKNGKGRFINGEGSTNANVTVYGPQGADDIHNYTGYTMTSDADKYGAIDEGLYKGSYIVPGKDGQLSSHWALNNSGNVPSMDNEPNTSPYAGTLYGKPFKNGIYIHSTNPNGSLGKTVSVGCLLILDSDWSSFKSVMSGVKDFSVRVNRIIHQRVPLQGVTGPVPGQFVITNVNKRD
jgi:hypothetical protein